MSDSPEDYGESEKNAKLRERDYANEFGTGQTKS